MSENVLIDRIYEAAVVPELWQSVIEATAEETGCFGGSLFTVGRHGVMVSASRNCEEHLQALLNDGWSERNIRAQRLVSKAHIGFVTDHDLCDEDEIASHAIYADFLRPRGLGWSAATHISGANDDVAIFCIDQLYSRGPISHAVREFLDGLRPHIARAAMLAAQFQSERLHMSLSSLDSVGIPAAAIDRAGRVRQANQRFQATDHYLKIGACDRLEVQDPHASLLYRDALSLRDTDLKPRSIPVAGQGDLPPCVLHLIPVRRQARDVFSSIDAIVAMIPLNSPGQSFAEALRKLYDLTHAEARVAEGLVSGQTVQEIAQLHKVSVETVRTYIKRLLSKTGVKRQSEFIVFFSTFKFLER